MTPRLVECSVLTEVHKLLLSGVSGAAGCSGSCLPAAGPCPAPNVCPTYPPCPVGGGSYGGVGGASQTIFLEYAQPRAIAAGAPTLNTSAKAAMRGNPVG